MRVTFILAAAVSLTLSQQLPSPPPPPNISAQPPRDVVRRQAPEPVGTGIIRGRVMAADTGAPIRRAGVTLMPAPTSTAVSGFGGPSVSGAQPASPRPTITRPRTASTDAQGTFEVRDLPAGSYRLRAAAGQFSAQYLGMWYGAKRPDGPLGGDMGANIELADGQTFDKATIALLKGSVIAGRVTDETGEPLARVQVYTMFFPSGSSRGMRSGSGSSTDDLGQFRLWGLGPGDYVVVAEARGNTFASPDAPADKEEDRVGFLTTYYPGTPDESAAQRVRVKAASELSGVEIRMLSGRLLRMTGMIVDSQGRAARMMGLLAHRAAGGGANTYGFSSDDQGRFQIRNVPPGEYRLIVRPQPQMVRPGADGPQQPEVNEFANMPISLTSDLENVLVTTTPGATITGQIVFENGPPQPGPGQPPFQIRVNANMGDPTGSMGLPPPQPAVVNPDLTFTMKGLMGEYLLRTFVPQQYLKAVLLSGADDISDTPREFKNGDRVTLVLTSRAATVEGAVADTMGKPASQMAIVLFPDDKAAWRATSLRVRRAASDNEGRYKIQGVLPGRYYMIAVPRERVIGTQDATMFEELAKEATTVVVGEDEQRTVDLKVSGGES